MKTAIVLGANRGIGLEFVRQLKDNYKVIALCRKTSPELKSLDVEVIEGVELTSVESLEDALSKITDKRLDLFVHVAGIFLRESFENLNFETIEEQFLVNSIAPLKAVEVFHRKFSKDTKVALLTSRMGSIADNDSGGAYGYRMSKAALNAGAKSLAVDLKSQGISIFLLHPGYVKTDMTNHMGNIDTKESVIGMLSAINSRGIADSGSFINFNNEILPW